MLKTSEVYSKLYHYTTYEGLLGILKTNSLWATNFKFLNDSSEVILFRNKLIQVISPIVRAEYEKMIKQNPDLQRFAEANGGLDSAIGQDARAFVEAKYDATGEEIYVISFCGEYRTGLPDDEYINANGLLSQWRGYGGNGGFALVMSTEVLEDFMERENNLYDYNTGHISDLVYSDDEERFKSKLSEPINDISNYLKEMLFLPRGATPPDATKAYPAFVQCSSRYKHRSFKEENEVRIVCLPAVQDEERKKLAKESDVQLKPEKPRKFRNKNGEQILYVELFGFDGAMLPIEKIIVGPHREKEARATALRAMLRNTNIEVTISDIPYIG